MQGGSALLLLRVFFIFKLQQDLTGHDGSREEEIVREITDNDEDNDDAAEYEDNTEEEVSDKVGYTN